MSLENTIIYDFAEWQIKTLEHEKNIMGDSITCASSLRDYQIANYIKPFITGYMTAPVGLLSDNVVLEAKSRRSDSIEDIINGLHAESETHDIYLYGIWFTPSVPMYVTYDPETFEPVTLDYPRMTDTKFIIRYASVKRV